MNHTRTNWLGVLIGVLGSGWVQLGCHSAPTAGKERPPLRNDQHAAQKSISSLENDNGVENSGAVGGAMGSASGGGGFMEPFPGWRSEEPLIISAAALRPPSIVFQQPYEDSVVLPLSYEAIASLREKLSARIKINLLGGEAHITLVTPPEVAAIKDLVPVAEMVKVARQMKFERVLIEPLCLGRGDAKIEGRAEQTYFVVVVADHFFDVRAAIEKLYRSRGGMSERYQAAHYFPHITVGFTKQDLHEEEGVRKDTDTCYLPLQVIPIPDAK